MFNNEKTAGRIMQIEAKTKQDAEFPTNLHKISNRNKPTRLNVSTEGLNDPRSKCTECRHTF